MTTTTQTTPAQFIVGRSYSFNSACDSNCWWTITVVRRTARTVTFTEDGCPKEITRRIKDKAFSDGGEWIMPHGSFSMAPTVAACNVNAAD